MRRLIAAAAAALLGTPALGHAGERHDLGWTLDPVIAAPLALLLFLDLAGWRRLYTRSERGRSRLPASAGLFLSGWLLLALALLSPLHGAGEVSFTMHMIEHEIIMLPAALLVVASRPGAILMWGLPASARAAVAAVVRLRLWDALLTPFLATALQALALIAWHVPALFDRALDDDGWHIAQHASFLVTALLFWAAMLPRRRERSALVVSALCLFVTSAVGSGLGALMALGESPWYRGYAEMGMTPFGLSAVQDQQLAGIIMWVPGGMFHLAAALLALLTALSQPQKVSPIV
jgi:cytochrome c oxidase assembly factor CtaG